MGRECWTPRLLVEDCRALNVEAMQRAGVFRSHSGSRKHDACVLSIGPRLPMPGEAAIQSEQSSPRMLALRAFTFCVAVARVKEREPKSGSLLR